MVVLVAAIWSYMLLLAPGHQSLDERAHNLGEQLKCPVCQAESVADSPSWVAQQLRASIRQQMQEGRSDQQIVQYLQQRYGNGIVWNPPWQGFALLAWVIPIGLLLIGMLLIALTARDWRALTLANAQQSTRDAEASSAAPAEEDSELARYRQQFIAELAADDPLFEQYGKEAR